MTGPDKTLPYHRRSVAAIERAYRPRIHIRSQPHIKRESILLAMACTVRTFLMDHAETDGEESKLLPPSLSVSFIDARIGECLEAEIAIDIHIRGVTPGGYVSWEDFTDALMAQLVDDHPKLRRLAVDLEISMPTGTFATHRPH